MKLVFATHNANKLSEVRALLQPQFEVIGLTDLNDHEEIPENEPTLEGNALVKARTVFERHGLPCFSDDTGLEIEALNGEPGVYSARYAGVDKDAERNMAKVLEKLGNNPNRKAQFRTAIALVNGTEEHVFNGVVAGQITHEKCGNEGFGYDPIFIPQGNSKSFAQMSGAEKNKISHRGRAINALVAHLQEHGI